MGRSSKARAAENRERVVETAARLFQQRGLGGVGIAELMRESGMTHGAFYKQFPSKDEVLGEAVERAMRRSTTHWGEILSPAPEVESGPVETDPVLSGGEARGNGVERLVDRYFSGDMAAHRCAMPALAADVSREDRCAPARVAYGHGVRDMAAVLTAGMGGDRARALGLLAAMVGAVSLARALDDDGFAQDIMAAVRGLAKG